MKKIDWFYRRTGCTACGRADRFIDTHEIEVEETVPASRKLQADDCQRLAQGADRLIAMKGKQVDEFDLTRGMTEESLAAMLGPTGNMRAPLIKAGKLLLVGYNDSVFDAELR